MKILILTNFDVGLYQFRRELLTALLAKHEVVISLPDGDLVRPLEALGCRFIDTPLDRRGINPVTDGKLLLRYWNLLRDEKPDLVITYLQGAFFGTDSALADCPVTEYLCSHVLSLPIHPYMEDADIELVCSRLMEYAHG